MRNKRKQASTGDVSKPFMGKFLWLFQPQALSKAQKVFNSLDDKLNPRAFLIGIPAEDGPEGTPICLEPADDCGYQPEVFSGVMDLAKQFVEQEEAKRPFAKPPAEDTQKKKTPGEAIQGAILKLLSETDGERGVVSYCSVPTTVGNHRVCCVLQLDANTFNSHYSLKVKQVGTITRLPGSLLDSATVEFLKVCSKALREHNAGLDVDALGREPEEILRAAGRELTFRAAYAGHGPMPHAFDALNLISSMHQEGEKAGGEMLIVTHEHPDFLMPIAFKDWVSLRDHRAARKILEMAQTRNVLEPDEEKRFYLLTTGESIYGIGRMNKDYDREYSEIYTIRFTGHYSWELIHDGHVMMEVHYGHPSLPKKRIDKKVFSDHVERIFTTSTPDVDALWWIVETAAEQKHGTMVVISSAAQSEAQRLAGQSMLIEPTVINDQAEESILLMLTSIDGALLVDPAGTCHAVGVILDGKAVAGKGTRARGARYNSAIRYIAEPEGESKCLAVVISEDGMIDLVPKLLPRIQRSEINEHLEKVREAVSGEVVNKKQYYRAMQWLSEHRFYLPAEVCDELNEVKEVTKERLLKESGSSMTQAEFIPNEEMNPSYFKD
jgi:hypothetical protein